MTRGPDPPRVIYGDPLTPSLAKVVESWPELGHLWRWGWTPIARGRPRPAARPNAEWWAQPADDVSNDRYARSHGKMTFPAATSRREKMRCDLFTGSSM